MLSDFFRDQTLLDEQNAVLPDIHVVPYPDENNLTSIVLTPDEVKLNLKALPIGKATGSDDVSNRILSALADELSALFFNQSLRDVPNCFKESHVYPIPKRGDPMYSLTIDIYLC